MSVIHLYVLFNGNCSEAFEFYRSVFGNEFVANIRYADVSRSEDMPTIADKDKNKGS